MRESSPDDVRREVAHFSRYSVESLCLIHAVGPTGCIAAELPARLGLSPALSEALAGALEPLRDAGWVQINDGRIAVTEAGAHALEDALAKAAATTIARSDRGTAGRH